LVNPNAASGIYIMRNFLEELKRRNVIKASLAYFVVAWAIIQVADIIFPVFDFSPHALRYVIYPLLGLFPFWVLFAYRFEWTPLGFRKTEEVEPELSVTRQTGRRLNMFTVGGLSLVVLLLLMDRLFNITTLTNTKREASIAVLPFTDMSQSHDQEYFSDGLTEELLNVLAKMPNLKVIARTSSFAFKGKNEDLRVIGEKLGVAHILEGSVRKSGNQLRITAQLITVEDGAHLWSETYDRNLDDIFKIQDEIAAAVGRHLALALLNKTNISKEMMNPEAYSLFLEGKFFYEHGNQEDYKRATEKFKAAIAIDPHAAIAFSFLAHLQFIGAARGYTSLDEGMRSARQTATEASQIDPNLADAYMTLAEIYETYEWNFKKAYETRAIAERLAEPGSVTALKLASRSASERNNFDEAIDFQKQAITLDPLNASAHANLAYLFWENSDYSNTVGSYQKCLELAPDYAGVNCQIAMAQLLMQKNDEALVSINQEKDDFWKTVGTPFVYFNLHRVAEANAALDSLINQYGDIAACQVAEVYAYRGEKEKAFEWLERAYLQRDTGLFDIDNDPLMDIIHADQRWNQFLKKIKSEDAKL
jgi:adenylate cyclase